MVHKLVVKLYFLSPTMVLFRTLKPIWKQSICIFKLEQNSQIEKTNNLQVEELRSLARLIIDLQLERSAVSLAIFLDARSEFYAHAILLVFTCSGVGVVIIVVIVIKWFGSIAEYLSLLTKLLLLWLLLSNVWVKHRAGALETILWNKFCLKND